MTDQPAQLWRSTLREVLLAARKDRDATRIAALRSALGAIDNAETPDEVRIEAASSGKIAGSVAGLGAAEVPRRELSDKQIRDLLQAEVDERLARGPGVHRRRPRRTCHHAARRGSRAHRPARGCLRAVEGWR